MAFASMSRPFQSIHLQVILIFCVNLLWLPHVRDASAIGNETDYLALLKFQESISNDPRQVLSSWNSSNHFCSWYGIICNQKHQRVRELNLQGYGLYGTISPHVGNLSFLRNLYLNNNGFYGEIPPQLGRLFRLQRLSLGENKLTGEIPINLTNCSELRQLELFANSLVGEIPFQIGSLKKLEILVVSRNNLSGKIPPSIWNFSSLDLLYAEYNKLEGSIAEEIGRLKKLRALSVGVNKLSGTLPSSLYNMSSLTLLSVTDNQLSRSQIPDNMFNTLPNLQTVYIDMNEISSSIPTSITNASSLKVFDISRNYFFGKVPSLGNLKDLQRLNLEFNNLGRNSHQDLDFITSLENCSKLEGMSLFHNNFGGPLPNSIANLSTGIIGLYLGDNKMFGTIPETLGKYTNLIALSMQLNQFTGTIPASFGNFYKMQELSLRGNQLSGEIPASLGNLSQLVQLDLANNMLEGKIPPTIGNMKHLNTLYLSENNLNEVIPLEVFSLLSLSLLLDLSHNSFNGSLPLEVANLKNLGTLDISENYLSGEIPGTIGECASMEYLNLKGNSFSGAIPPSLASLKGLKDLDLSQNKLSGSIPIGLQNISVLEHLNISYNELEGQVPSKGVFSNASKISVVGNNKLCGGISVLHLSPCHVKVDNQSKLHNLKFMIILICVSLCLLLSFILAIYWRKKGNKTSSSASTTIDQLSKLSYQNLHSATEGFSTHNLIGSGSFGLVYKGRIESEDKIVAIKVLNLQKKGAHKSFISECNALKNIRHRNLVKILTCCSSIDYKGQEFKSLIFEYMSNGSLENWMHPSQESVNRPPTLNLHQRLNILHDVSCALHYLHYECEQPIVHCDLKPSNILLDDDMVAHVSDFGLARLISTLQGNSQKQISTTGIKGTIGYAPPEYGIDSVVTTHGDVYSFGILVLEMLTGRRPTEEIFEDGHNLHSYVKNAYPNNLLDIVDSTLFPKQMQQIATSTTEEINVDELTLMHPKDENSAFSLFKIGLACSVESPKERVDMIYVTRELNHIRNAFHFG